MITISHTDFPIKYATVQPTSAPAKTCTKPKKKGHQSAVAQTGANDTLIVVLTK
jgi:hypothetical protein